MPTFKEERLAFFAEYGTAMGTWTNFEQAMYAIAANLFPEGMPRNMLGIGFTGIQGFQSKRLFVERCVTRAIIRLPNKQEMHAAWAELMAEADRLSHKRNHLAHYLTIAFPENEEGRRIALCPWYAKKSDPKDKPTSDSYCVKELIRTRREFVVLVVDTLNFGFRLQGLPKQLARPAPPQDDLPTIQQIVDQMHEELGHPRQSAKERKRAEDEKNAAASLTMEVLRNVEPETTPDAESGGRTAEDAGDPADPARPEGEGKA